MSKTQPDHANVRALKAPMAYRSWVVCPATVHQVRLKFLRLGVRARPAGSLTTNSLKVATVHAKRHGNVLQSIQSLFAPEESKNFAGRKE